MLLQTEKLKHTDSGLFFLLAGPCVIEGENMALNIAETTVCIYLMFLKGHIVKRTARE